MDDLTKLLSQLGEEEGNGDGKEALKGHVDRIWKFLDSLAESDPKEYQNFLQKQADAVGAGDLLKRSGAMPEKGEAEHPDLVVLGKKEDRSIALRVFNDKSDKSRGGSPFALKRKIRQQKLVEGLPAAPQGYTLVDIIAPQKTLSSALASEGDPDKKKAELSALVDSVAEWSKGQLGFEVEKDTRKVLVLKSRSERNREAAQGTSASDLPESVLSQIAGLASKGTDSPAAARLSRDEKPKQNAPLIQEISAEETPQASASPSVPCIASHAYAEDGGAAKVKAKLAAGLKIENLEIHWEKNSNALVFSGPGHLDYEAKLPAECKGRDYVAKYSQSSHKVTVKLKP